MDWMEITIRCRHCGSETCDGNCKKKGDDK